MKNTKQQIIKYTLFSWEEQRKNLTLGLFWLVLCLALAFFLMILWFGIMWPPYRDPEAMIVAGIVMLVAVFMAGHCFFIMYAEFILTPSLLEKHIVAWEGFAKEKLQEKTDAETRLKVLNSLVLNPEDKEDALRPFKNLIAADDALIKNADKLLPMSAEQLKTFRIVMYGKSLIERIFAMLRPYTYQFAILPGCIKNAE